MTNLELSKKEEPKFNLLIIKNINGVVYNFKAPCMNNMEEGEAKQLYIVCNFGDYAVDTIDEIILQFKRIDKIPMSTTEKVYKIWSGFTNTPILDDDYEIYCEDVKVRDMTILANGNPKNSILYSALGNRGIPLILDQFKLDVYKNGPKSNKPEIKCYENITADELELLVEMEKMGK